MHTLCKTQGQKGLERPITNKSVQDKCLLLFSKRTSKDLYLYYITSHCLISITKDKNI